MTESDAHKQLSLLGEDDLAPKPAQPAGAPVAAADGDSATPADDTSATATPDGPTDGPEHAHAAANAAADVEATAPRGDATAVDPAAHSAMETAVQDSEDDAPVNASAATQDSLGEDMTQMVSAVLSSMESDGELRAIYFIHSAVVLELITFEHDTEQFANDVMNHGLGPMLGLVAAQNDLVPYVWLRSPTHEHLIDVLDRRALDPSFTTPFMGALLSAATAHQ